MLAAIRAAVSVGDGMEPPADNTKAAAAWMRVQRSDCGGPWQGGLLHLEVEHPLRLTVDRDADLVFPLGIVRRDAPQVADDAVLGRDILVGDRPGAGRIDLGEGVARPGSLDGRG